MILKINQDNLILKEKKKDKEIMSLKQTEKQRAHE